MPITIEEIKGQKLPWVVPGKGVVVLGEKELAERVAPKEAKLFIKLRNIKSVESLEKFINRLV